MGTVKDIGPNRYDLTDTAPLADAARGVVKSADTGYIPDESDPPTASVSLDFIHNDGDFAILIWWIPTPQANTLLFDNGRHNLTYSYTNETMAANVVTGNDLLSSTGSVPIGRPCHIVWTADTSNHYLYVNGVLEDSDIFTADATAGSPPEWFDYVDVSQGVAGPVVNACTVLNRLVTAAEVIDLYSMGRPDVAIQDLGDTKKRASTYAALNESVIFDGASIRPGGPIRYTNSITTNGENSQSPINTTGDWSDVDDPIDDPGSDEIAPTSPSSSMTYWFDMESANPAPYLDGTDSATFKVLVRTDTGSAGFGDRTVTVYPYQTMVSGGALGSAGSVDVPAGLESFLVEIPWDPYHGSLDNDLGNLIIGIECVPSFSGSDCPAILAFQMEYEHSPLDLGNLNIPDFRLFDDGYTIIMEVEILEWINDTTPRVLLHVDNGGTTVATIYTKTGLTEPFGVSTEDPTAGSGTTPALYPGKYLLVASGDSTYETSVKGNIYLNGNLLLMDTDITSWPDLPEAATASIGSDVDGVTNPTDMRLGNFAIIDRRLSVEEVYDLWVELTGIKKWARELPKTVTSSQIPGGFETFGVSADDFEWDWSEAVESELSWGAGNVNPADVVVNSPSIPFVGSNKSLYANGALYDVFNGDALSNLATWWIRGAFIMDDNQHGPWESGPTGDVSSVNTSSSYTDVDDPVDSPPGGWAGTPTTSGSNWEMVMSFPDEVAGRKYARGDDQLELRVYCRKVGGGTGTLNAWVQDGVALNRQIITSGSVTSGAGEILTGTFSWDELDNGAGYDALRIRVQGIGGATYVEIDAIEVRQPGYAQLFVLGLYPEDTVAIGCGSDGWAELKVLDISDDSPDSEFSLSGVDLHDGLVHSVLLAHDGNNTQVLAYVDGVNIGSFDSSVGDLDGTTWTNGGFAYPETGTDIVHTNQTTDDWIYQGSDGHYASMAAIVSLGSNSFTTSDIETLSLPRIISGDPRFDYASIFYDFSAASGGLTNVMGGLDATEAGNPTYQATAPAINGIHEDVDYSVTLDGTGDGFVIPFRRNDYLFENNHTVSMYFRMSDTPPSVPALFTSNFVGTGNMSLYCISGMVRYRWTDGSNYDLNSSGIDPFDGAWHRVTVHTDWDEGETKMWLDGVLQGVRDISSFIPDEMEEVRIGHQAVAGISDFEGEIGAFTLFLGPMDDRLTDEDRAEL